MPWTRLASPILALGVLLSIAVAPAFAAPRGALTLTAQGGIGLPVGDFGDVSDPGPGGALSLDYWFRDDVAMGVDFGIHTWDAAAGVEAAASAAFSGPPGEVIMVDLGHRAFQYTPHARVTFPGMSDRGVPWIQVGAGLYDFTTTAKIARTSTGASSESSGSAAYFGINLGGGVDFALSPGVRLGGGIHYHWIQSGDDFASDISQFAIGAHLSTRLGR